MHHTFCRSLVLARTFSHGGGRCNRSVRSFPATLDETLSLLEPTGLPTATQDCQRPSQPNFLTNFVEVGEVPSLVPGCLLAKKIPACRVPFILIYRASSASGVNKHMRRRCATSLLPPHLLHTSSIYAGERGGGGCAPPAHVNADDFRNSIPRNPFWTPPSRL